MEASESHDGSFGIGEFEFDPATGDVRPTVAGGEVVRLAPQPAKLLALLALKDGALLTREEIQREIWPEIHVDFDQSLSFCLHQVRSALGDSGTASRYVETLPRRGYRLLQPVRALGAPPLPPAPAARSRRGAGMAAVALLVLLAALALYRQCAQTPPAPTGTAPRLAIMPFRPPPGVAVEGEPWLIAERLLLTLGRLGPETLGVIGPATTTAYNGDFSDLRRLLDDVELDYIVNGRFVTSSSAGSAPVLLVELIRAGDGVHLWVERFDDLADPDAIAERIRQAVLREILA
jgi:DNA-binding winged helix-turn-helix (wHTH) protein/TolB-like protein